MTITFCRHSDYRENADIEWALTVFLETTVGDMPCEVLLGRNGRFDSFAFRICKAYRETHPNMTLIFVTPYMLEGEKDEYEKRELSSYDLVLYPSLERVPKRLAILYRNRYMVDSADYVVAYITHSFGGAYKTYSYAKRKGKDILNLAE